MPRAQIATPDLTALFSGGVAPSAFELRENRCETTDVVDDRAPYVQSSGIPKRRSGQRQPELKTSVNTTRRPFLKRCAPDVGVGRVHSLSGVPVWVMSRDIS